VEVSLDGKPEPTADCCKFREAHIAELGEPEAEIAEPEGAVGIGRVELREEPCGASVGREELLASFTVRDSLLARTVIAQRAAAGRS
jgi:hypothetical protein